MIGSIPKLDTLAITTNGIALKTRLSSFRAAGVNLLNISLDTLVPAKFKFITRRSGFEKVIDSIESAIEHGFNPVKVNVVVMRGFNDDELTNFVEFTKEKPIEVRFIEYMPFDDNGWKDNKLVPYSEMLDVIRRKFPNLQRQMDGPNETSKTYWVPGYVGKVGFITSMSQHFCGGCNRLRITADGNLKVCLFGPNEVSLRDAMRSGATNDQIKEIIGEAVKRKKAKHAGMYEISKTKNRPMILIGG